MAISSRASLAAAIIPLLLIILPTASARTSMHNVMITNEVLSSGEALYNRDSSFTMQTDCNLVLGVHGKLAFQTGTAGRGVGCSLRLTDRGQLRITDSAGGLVWNSAAASTGAGLFAAVLREDNAVVVYGPRVWWSNDRPPAVPARASLQLSNLMYAGEHVFVFQPTGQAVIYGPAAWGAGFSNAMAQSNASLNVQSAGFSNDTAQSMRR